MSESSPAKGFIYASLVYCVGSMAIVGSIADGVKGDHSILFTKAIMDGIISIPFAASMGRRGLGFGAAHFVVSRDVDFIGRAIATFF